MHPILSESLFSFYSSCFTFIFVCFIMPPLLKKGGGHIDLPLSVRPSVRPEKLYYT